MGQGQVYLPILFLGLLAFGFAAFSVAAASFTGPKRYNRAKLDAYECGIQPTPQPIGGGKFPVKYYLTAMLFIVFDIEIVFLYPFATVFRDLGAYGLGAMGIFLGVLIVPFAYLLSTGALDWGPVRQVASRVVHAVRRSDGSPSIFSTPAPGEEVAA